MRGNSNYSNFLSKMDRGRGNGDFRLYGSRGGGFGDREEMGRGQGNRGRRGPWGENRGGRGRGGIEEEAPTQLGEPQHMEELHMGAIQIMEM